MEAFKTLIWIINIFSSLAIIGLVLMQHGKGADAGASFGGSGSAQGVFGSGGNANFLSRMTGISAIVFFSTCLALGYIHTNSGKSLNFDDVRQSSPAAASAVSTATDEPATLTVASGVAASASLAVEESKIGDAALAAGAAAAGAAALKANADKAEKTADTDKAKSSKADKKPVVEKSKKDKDLAKPKKKAKKSETKK